MAIVGKLKIDKKAKEASLSIKRSPQVTKNSIRKGWYFVGKELQKEARRLVIEGPKTGRLYRIKGRKRKHRASAPGEPPATLSGDTQKSINFIVRGWDRMTFGAGDGNKLIYPSFLEEGTPRMAKRPYLIVSIKTKQKQTRTIMNQQIEKGLSAQ